MNANFSFFKTRTVAAANFFFVAAIIAVLMLMRQVGATDGESLIPESRIVNGQKNVNVKPFMAYIDLRTSICGGSFIGKRFVVTAAHCLEDYNKETGGVVILNSNKWDKASLPKSAVERKIMAVIRHEKFLNTSLDFDIGIVILDCDVSHFTVKPVRYATEKLMGKLRKMKDIKLLGWGRTIFDDAESISYDLLTAEFSILDINECSTGVMGMVVTQNMLCLKDCVRMDGKESCSGKGDSGGPYLYKFGKLFPCDLLVGVHGGFLEHTGTMYGIRVASFADWIKKYTDIAGYE